MISFLSADTCQEMHKQWARTYIHTHVDDTYVNICVYIHDRWRVGPPPCLHCSVVVGIKVPDVRCQVSGFRCQVPGARCQVSGVRRQLVGVTCQVPGVKFKGEVPGARCQV